MNCRVTTQWALNVRRTFTGRFYDRPTSNNIEHITAAFKLFDKNGDGHVSKQELYDRLSDHGVSMDEVKVMIHEVDLDEGGGMLVGNGTIELEEFLAMMAKCVQAPSETELWTTFSNFDKDRNGKIDVDELMCSMGELGAVISREDAAGMIAMADSDGDGHIDFDEFKILMAQLAQEDCQ